MKKTIFTVLSIMLILLMCAGCAAEAEVTDATTENEQTVITDDDTAPKTVKYEFFYTESLGGDLAETASMKNAYNHGFGGFLSRAKGLDDVDVKRVSSIDGKEYTYDSSKIRYRDSETKEEAYSYYSRFDEYKTTDGSLIAFLHGTDSLTKYTNEAVEHNYKGERNLEEEQIKAAADEFLKKIFTEAELSEYTYSYSNTGLFAYSVLYERFIHGYRTEEYLNVLFNISGEVYGYDAPNIKKFSEQTEALSKESLDKAHQMLTEKIDSMGLDITYRSNGTIVKNNEGKLFMKIVIRYNKDGSSNMTSIMINLD